MTFTKTPYIIPPFAEVEKTVRGAMNDEIYQKYVARLEAATDVAVSSITYLSDGLKVTGLEVLPEFAAGEKAPLIVYNRGGNRDFGGLSAAQIINLLLPMARSLRGGVLASNYRGNMGSEGREEFGGADVNDVLRLIEIGQQQPWWDGKNIFMLGWSRGGMMTYRAIAEGAPITAAAIGAGVADLFESSLARPEMEEKVYAQLVPHYTPENRKALLRERSALCWPEKITVPLLLLHGDADTKVGVVHARRMHEALSALGRSVKYIEFPNGGHGLMRENETVMCEVAAWFTAHRT
ncbi:MAG: alpha/beta hydrolase family protein [Rickettsiales bacterium]